jgi:ABC-type Fe3+-hydroxamate transport system substrate-binding protein
MKTSLSREPAGRLLKCERSLLAGAALVAFLCCGIIGAAVRAVAQSPEGPAPRRVVSLIPATTEILFTIGAGDRLVAVGTYDRYPPETERLPKVGGLVDPDAERIMALRPDLVIVYSTQSELRRQLDRARIPYYVYEHRALPDIPDTIRTLGRRLGLATAGETAASNLERSLAKVRSAVAGRPRPRTMLVFGRDPGSLRNVYASGGYGFLADLLDVAGGENLFGDVPRQSVQASTEMILARRPDVIIELRYGDGLATAQVPEELRAWDTLTSVPAVKSRRVHVLVGDEFVVPGPRIVLAAESLARTLHPDVFK